MFSPTPYSEEEIWKEFQREGSISKHLLTIYSLAVGINAKRIIDIGIGSTTKALRMAAAETDGIVFSCDADKKRFSGLLEHQCENWKLDLCASESFLKKIDGPIDFAMHDGAHDYLQVKLDLELIIPKMKTFGLICVHDSQQSVSADDVLKAIRDATTNWEISLTTLPYCNGLSIIRLEKGNFPNIMPNGSLLDDGRIGTELTACPMRFDSESSFNNANQSIRRYIRWRLRKILRGY